MLFSTDSDIILYIEIYRTEKILQKKFWDIDKNSRLNKQYFLVEKIATNWTEIQKYLKKEKNILLLLFAVI